MGRITREMADKAARQLAAIAYDKKIEKAKNDFKSMLEGIIKTYIPAPILAVMEEYSSYLEKCVRLFISDGNDCVYTYTIPVLIPAVKEIKVSHDELVKLKSAKKLLESLEAKKVRYKEEVSDALCLSIRTEKRCAETFPEAMQYLNFSKTTALAPKFDDLRKQLIQ
jgi:hypothetical protein